MKTDKINSKKEKSSLQRPRKVRLNREAACLQKKLADYRYVPNTEKAFHDHQKLTKELDKLAKASEPKYFKNISLPVDRSEKIKKWLRRFRSLRTRIWNYITDFENKNTPIM